MNSVPTFYEKKYKSKDSEKYLKTINFIIKKKYD